MLEISPAVGIFNPADETMDYTRDFLGTLLIDLTGLVGFPTVLNELLQNAEDAKATEFNVDICDDALWVGNDSVFEDEHFAAITKIGSGSKRQNQEQIGAFGLGFVSVYQLTDTPILVSRDQRLCFVPLEQKVYRRAALPNDGRWATTFTLPWAFNPSALRQALNVPIVDPANLENYLREAQVSLEEAGLFLKNVQTIRLYRNGQPKLEVSIKRGAITDGCTPLTVRVNGKERLYEHRVMDVGETARAWLKSREEKRREEVALIRPLGKTPKNFNGRLYAHLPTQSQTGMPFHINGDFYPTSDRKDIIWEGEHKSVWNRLLLETIAISLEPVLNDFKVEGADDLYRFCSAVQGAEPSSDALKPFIKTCWGACIKAFEHGAFFHTDQDTWVDATTVLRHEKHVPEQVRNAIRTLVGWQFMPADYLKYAKTLEALGATGLELADYLTALKAIFAITPSWLEGDAAAKTARLIPFLELLEHFEKKLNADQLSELILFNWGVAENGSIAAPADLERITATELQALHPWIDTDVQAYDGWLAVLPPKLAVLIPEFNLETTLEAMQETTSEEVLEFHTRGWSCADLYTFLAERQVSDISDIADLSIFPSEGYDAFHTADQVVRPGDLTDQFNIRRTMDAELSSQHSDWLETVGVAKLDHEEYFNKLLIEHFEGLTEISKKRSVAAFLVMHSAKIASQTVKTWRSQCIAECTDGQWRAPSTVYFNIQLMNDLFGESYPRLVKSWEEHPKAKPLFMRFGVQTEATRDEIIAELERRATEPVNSSSIQVREKVVKWLNGVSDEIAFGRLSKIPWLPDLDKKRWFAPVNVYPKLDMRVMASSLPAGKVFCGIEELPDQLVKLLKMLRPTPELVVGHLENMVARNLPCSALVYQYLERWARDRVDSLKPFINRLRQIPCIPIGKNRWQPNAVFTRIHSLTPWRPVLKTFLEHYPALVKELGVRKEPEREDYIDVLIEIAKRVDQQPQLPQNQLKAAAETVKYCLRALAKVHSDHPNDLGWMKRLQPWKIVPLGTDTPAFATANRMYILDVSEAFVKRYTLEPLRNHFVPFIGEEQFWRDLGARSLKESTSITYVGGAGSQHIPGMTGKLQQLQPAILRVARAATATKRDLDELTTIFERLEVHQDRRIIARRIVQGSPVQLPQSVELDSAYDPASQRLLVKEATWDMCVNALADALDIPQGSYLGNLRFIVIRSRDLGDAMNELTQMGIPELPARWKPAEVLETIDVEIPELSEVVAANDINLDFPADELKDQPEPDDQSALPAKTNSNQSSQWHQASQKPRADLSLLSIQSNSVSARENALDRRDFVPDNADLESQRISSPLPPTPRLARAGSHPDSASTDRQRSRPKPQQPFKTFAYLEPGEPDDNEDKVESIAHATDRRGMAIVMAYETRHGRNPADVSSDYGLGYDIESTDSDGVIRYIELKTTNEPWGERGVTLSANQFQKALHKTLADNYWLYVVDDLQGQPNVHRIWNPAGMTKHFVFDEGWLDFADKSDS